MVEVPLPGPGQHQPVVGLVRLLDRLVVVLVPVRPEVVPVLLGDGPDPGRHGLPADRGREVPGWLGDHQALRRVTFPRLGRVVL